jgi:hypothetical protein
MHLPYEQNPTINAKSYGNLFITRLAPGGGYVHIEWSHNGEYVHPADEFIIKVFEPDPVTWEESQVVFLYRLDSQSRETDISGLCNGVDYVINLSSYQNGIKVAQAVNYGQKEPRVRRIRSGSPAKMIHPSGQ